MKSMAMNFSSFSGYLSSPMVRFALIIGLPLIIVFIVFSFLIPKKQQSILSWKNIIAGKTSLSEAQSALGTPLTREQNGDQLTLTYQSTYQYQPNVIEAENEVVTFVKESVSANDPSKFSQYKEKYGEPSFIAYSADVSDAYSLYVYLEEGFAVNAHTREGNIYQIWHFTPTTLTDFVTKYAQYLRLTPEQPESVE